MFALLVVFFFIIILRVLFMMCKVMYGDQEQYQRRHYTTVKTAIVIGSGGHTSEMLRLIDKLNPERYVPRTYILASGDVSSEVKILKLESKFCEHENNSGYSIIKIPRSREVGQSYITSIVTTLYSVLYSLPVMLMEKPALVICNGPGTCIPICLIAFLMKAFYISETTIIFVESICRVTTLSLSGKILLFFADVIFVQWSQLANLYERTKYIGRLV